MDAHAGLGDVEAAHPVGAAVGVVLGLDLDADQAVVAVAGEGVARLVGRHPSPNSSAIRASVPHSAGGRRPAGGGTKRPITLNSSPMKPVGMLGIGRTSLLKKLDLYGVTRPRR